MEENIITQRQHQVLLGTLLGDAHLELAPNKKSARLRLFFLKTLIISLINNSIFTTE